MAYQALYRKYRPATFDEVVGQRHIVQTLKNAVVQNRIAHAYLFCGPRGTGKTSIAKIFARTLNCTSENNDRPCGHCENCRMALNGSHPDIIEIDAASNNGVDEVRNLIDRVKYAPMEGKYKVYIIDEVHMMTASALNALLKTIEEPPEHVVFVFATTEPNKVLPTIISRCQRFDFTKVSQKDIEYRIHVICEQEKIAIEDEAVSLIALLSDGGMRDALSILDQCRAYCENKIHVDDVRQIYGILTKEDIGSLFEKLYQQDVEDVIRNLQDAYERGMDMKRLTSDFISLLKESIILDYSPNSTLVGERSKSVVQKYMAASPLPFRIRLLDELMDTYNKYPYASNVLDYLETALLKSISQSYEHEKAAEKSEIRYSNHANTASKSHESTSDKSEIIEKKVKKANKIAKKDSKAESDVSRETLKQSEIPNHKIIFDDEYILQLLVGSDKKIRKEDEYKYEDRILYQTDPDYGKYAGSLNTSSIFAASDHYLLICVNTEMEANEINLTEEKESYAPFMKKLIGKPKKIFAIDMNQKQRVTKDFVKRMKEGTLPSPVDVTVPMEEEKKPENTEENELKKIFPNLKVEED